MQRDIRALERLVSVRSGLKKRDRQGFTALHWTVLTSFTEGTKLVLQQDKKPDVNASSREGYTPLHIAAFVGGEEGRDAGTALIEAGASVNTLTRRGASPLSLAAMNGLSCIAVLRVLIANHCALELRCSEHNHRTPLELAISSHDDGEVVQAL